MSADPWKVEQLDHCESTMGVCRARIERGQAEEGLTVVTDTQFDSLWPSPPSVNLYFTTVIDHELIKNEWPSLGIVTSLAIAQTLLAEYRLRPVMDDPDRFFQSPYNGFLYLEDSILAGVATEIAEESEDRFRCIVGCGVNVNAGPDQYKTKVALDATRLFGGPMTSMFMVSGRRYETRLVLDQILHRLKINLAIYRENGPAGLAPELEGFRSDDAPHWETRLLRWARGWGLPDPLAE